MNPKCTLLIEISQFEKLYNFIYTTSGNGKIVDTVNRLLIAGVLSGRRVE